MDFEEIKQKNITLRKVINIDSKSLNECLRKLSVDGLNHLYKLYDVLNINKKTKQAKINYLVSEIQSQFIDEFRFMMDNDERMKFMSVCKNKNCALDFNIVDWLSFGFLFIDENNELIVPTEIYWIIEDLFIQK